MGNQPTQQQNKTLKEAHTAPLHIISRLSTARDHLQASSSLQRRNSSRLIIHNGVTGTYISAEICAIAYRFYAQNIEILPVQKKLEIGCSIFFVMAVEDESKNVIINATNKPIEQIALRYMEMMSWLFQHLMMNDINLYALLRNLGTLHKHFGIKIHNFPIMLQAINETFSYYFPKKYGIDVKYALDEIFSLVAQIMTGEQIEREKYLMVLSKQFNGKKIPFLQNLSTCLQCRIGRSYLFRFLMQSMCDEIVVFLKSLSRFKRLTSSCERFVAARNIKKDSIDHSAVFCLNLSHETRLQTIEKMKEMELCFATEHEIEIHTDFFAEVEYEIYKLLMNQWVRFVREIKRLQTNSLYN